MEALTMPALLLGLAALTFANEPSSKGSIPALIKELGAESYAQREAASKALARIGPPALSELCKALRAEDLEVRLRVRRLVDAIGKDLFREMRSFDNHSGSVNAVAFSPDGKRAASGDHRAIRLWDLQTGKQLSRTDEHDDRVMALAFSPDGKTLASGSEDRTVRMWDTSTLDQQKVLKGHKWDVRAVAFSRDGKRLASASRDGTIRVWDARSGEALKVIRVGQQLAALALSPDGQYALAGSVIGEPLVRVSLDDDRKVVSLEGHTGRVMGVCYTTDGKRAVSAGQDGTLRIWDMRTLKVVSILKGHDGAISSIAISADGQRAVSGGMDTKLYIWDLAAGTLIREAHGPKGPIWSVAIGPDGKRGLSGSHDGSMKLWTVGY
jgi:WD40 repeat protein